jgi:prophage tail gpP-like protein
MKKNLWMKHNEAWIEKENAKKKDEERNEKKKSRKRAESKQGKDII